MSPHKKRNQEKGEILKRIKQQKYKKDTREDFPCDTFAFRQCTDFMHWPMGERERVRENDGGREREKETETK